jgi:CheY-like chemotaxis protein
MRTILVIEDSAAMREELTEILRLEGFRVVAGCDGLEGMALAQREHPDLILCDVTMPNLDGFGTLRAVRADPMLAATPFVLLSSRKEDADLQQAIDLEADAYLTKPCEIGSLLAAINATMPVGR